jgi:NTE family protein
MEASMDGENRVLALSGGGYRAMLFHVGALWRLNELGELSTLTHVSSVSGGSIVAGVLAHRWKELQFNTDGVAPWHNFHELIVAPIWKLASRTIDWPSALGAFLPLRSAATCVEAAYSRHLFGATTLSDLPSVPTFYFNATNFQTGAVWTFSKNFMGDPSVGETCSDDIPLARAVAASGAFPPFLAPARLNLRGAKWRDYSSNPSPLRAYDDVRVVIDVPPEQLELFRRKILLSDGGIADNLGVVALWGKRGDWLVSDGGARTRPQAQPSRNWFMQLIRTVDLISDEPSQLRAYNLIARFADHDEGRIKDTSRTGICDGAYWNMRWPPEMHKDVTFPPLSQRLIEELAGLSTRLKALSDLQKEQLINWGYIAANHSMPYWRRLWILKGLTAFDERNLPFPETRMF